MARNTEKAMTLMSLWTTFKNDFHSNAANKRPLLATDCSSLPDAEKHRRDLVRDISRKIASIHNASLGEHRLRELNDEINKLQRQRHYWEVRIKELGGMDYHSAARKSGSSRHSIDIEGRELPGTKGYKYYGAAKELPGVRELFAATDDDAERHKAKKSRRDLHAGITPDYYGFRDDDEDDEAEAEAGARVGAALGVEAGASSAMEGEEDGGDEDESPAATAKGRGKSGGSGSGRARGKAPRTGPKKSLRQLEMAMEKHWRAAAEQEYAAKKRAAIQSLALGGAPDADSDSSDDDDEEVGTAEK